MWGIFNNVVNDYKNPDKTFDMWMNRADFFEPRSRAGRQSWLASCFYEKGDLAKARTMLQEYLRLAIQYNIQRAIIGTQIYIIRIDLDQGNLIGAADALDRISSAAREYQDRHYTARIQRTYGRLYALREDFIAAQMAFHIAIDLFERLGAGYELAEAREELARLEAGAAPTPAPPI